MEFWSLLWLYQEYASWPGIAVTPGSAHFPNNLIQPLFLTKGYLCTNLIHSQAGTLKCWCLFGLLVARSLLRFSYGVKLNGNIIHSRTFFKSRRCLWPSPPCPLDNDDHLDRDAARVAYALFRLDRRVDQVASEVRQDEGRTVRTSGRTSNWKRRRLPGCSRPGRDL